MVIVVMVAIVCTVRDSAGEATDPPFALFRLVAFFGVVDSSVFLALAISTNSFAAPRSLAFKILKECASGEKRDSSLP